MCIPQSANDTLGQFPKSLGPENSSSSVLVLGRSDFGFILSNLAYSQHWQNYLNKCLRAKVVQDLTEIFQEPPPLGKQDAGNSAKTLEARCYLEGGSMSATYYLTNCWKRNTVISALLSEIRLYFLHLHFPMLNLSLWASRNCEAIPSQPVDYKSNSPGITFFVIHVSALHHQFWPKFMM